MATLAYADPTAVLPPITGLEDYWARYTFRVQASPPADARDAVLLDMLGLGLEQTSRWLATRPAFAAFRDWIVATAGVPDPAALARHEAWRAGAPPPRETSARLAAIDAMPPALDAEEIAGFERDGYVVLRGAIGADEAAAAADCLWETIGADRDDPETWYGLETQGIMVQRFQHPALEPARRAPRVHKAFAQLWGTADLWATTDRMSFNPPERPGRPFPGPHLHWDVSLASPIPFSVGGILYLTDTPAHQGALQVVPGFHHRLPAWRDALGVGDPRQVDLSAGAVRIGAGAGDLVIWRQDLPHGASANSGTRPRLAHYVTMYPASLAANPVWR